MQQRLILKDRLLSMAVRERQSAQTGGDYSYKFRSTKQQKLISIYWRQLIGHWVADC